MMIITFTPRHVDPWLPVVKPIVGTGRCAADDSTPREFCRMYREPATATGERPLTAVSW
jgi:hypothetical protein